MKPYKASKRRVAGKLRKLTNENRDKKRIHDRRTGRNERKFARKKVIPADTTSKDNRTGE